MSILFFDGILKGVFIDDGWFMAVCSQKSANGQQNLLAAPVSAGSHKTSPYFIGGFITIAVAIWQLF